MTLIDKAEALLPCPFCGGEAELWNAHDNRPAWIACMGRCAVLISKEHATDAEAIAAWNRRAALAPTDAPDLSDPVTVHANMLRGSIAKPTVEQIVHLYGREAFQPMIDVAIAKALEKACLAVSEHADWPEDEHGRTEQVGLFARVINAIRGITPALSPALAPTDAAQVDHEGLLDWLGSFPPPNDKLRQMYADYQKAISDGRLKVAPTDAAHVNETPKSEHDGADVLTDAQARPAWLSNCVVCGRIVDTREKDEGGDGHGCEYAEGWTCSSDCAEKLHPDPEWMKEGLVAQAREAALRADEMLRVAARYIRDHYPDGLIRYDDADCDGACVADDCEAAADALIDKP